MGRIGALTVGRALTGLGNDAIGGGSWTMGGMRTGQVPGEDIAERLLLVAVAALEIGRELSRGWATRHVAVQLVRSATAAGANYEEARGAESRADFVHKLGVAMKELREAHFWLRLVHRGSLARTDVTPLLSEASELVAILFTSRKTATANSRPK